MNPAASSSPAPPRFPRSAFDWAWLLFLVWTAVGFVVMPLDITAAQARAWGVPYGLGGAAAGILGISDGVWMLLAAVTVYLHAVASEGLPTARRQAAVVLVASTVFEWIGTRTGFPFGPYEYTDHFGPRIAGVVPMAIPLAWLVVIFCGRNVVLSLRPVASRLELGLGTAVIAVLTDLNLEPVAWHVRQYWIWYPLQNPPPSSQPPWQNYAAWFVLSFALACVLPADHGLRPRRPMRRRPVLVLLLLNALLGFVHPGVITRHLSAALHSHPPPVDVPATTASPAASADKSTCRVGAGWTPLWSAPRTAAPGQSQG